MWKNVGLSLHYIHKRGRHYSAWQDIRGVYEDVTVLDDVGAGATGRPLEGKRLLSDPADRFFVQSNPPQMKTDVNAFTATLTKQMSKGWQTVVSYTYIHSKRLLPSGRNGRAFSQTTSLVFSDFGQNPNDFVNAGGLLLADRPHAFKVQLVAELPWQLLIGANYLWQSGRDLTRTRRIPDLGFPSDPTLQLEERDGSHRLPSQNQLDLRLQKQFPFGKKRRMALFADLLNTFNDGAYEDVLSRMADSDSFGVPSSFVLPRPLMLGAKLTF